MDPATIILIAKLVIAGIPEAMKLLSDIGNAGAVTPEQIAALDAHYRAAVAADLAAEAAFDASLPPAA